MAGGRVKLKLAACLLLGAVLAGAFLLLNGERSSDSDSTQQTQYELPASETEWLWELEHRSNLLGTYGFNRLKSALTAADGESLESLFADDFKGKIFENPLTTVLDGREISAVRQESTGSFTTASSSEFSERLLALRGTMKTVSSCSIGVKRISPLIRVEVDGRWTVLSEMWIRGLSEDRRIEVTTLFRMEISPPAKELLSSSAWIHEFELLETTVSSSAKVMFDDVTATSGVAASELHDNWTSSHKINNPGGVYACDFNRDGQTDFLVTDVNPVANGLFQATGNGHFKDVTNLIGLGRIKQTSLSQGNAAFVDLNNDGWLDLVHTEGAVWENQGGKEFVDRTAETNLFQVTDHLNTELKSISVADFDRDGDLDLYVLRRHEMPMSWLQETGAGPGNVLCKNLGNWQFEDVTSESGTYGHDSLIFTSVWLDANNDNWPDLAVINEFGDSFLYVNQQDGRFEHRDMAPKKSDFGSMGVDVGDIDNDGLIDVYVAGMYSKAGSRIIGNLADGSYPAEVMHRLDSLIDGSELYRNRGDLNFTAQGEKDHVHNIGWSWGPALADFNNDGWLDIYAPSGYMSRDRQKPDG